MPSKQRQITLLGKAYQVRCPVGEEQALREAVATLNKQLQHSQGNSGLSGREDIIMMTALNLCYQNLQLQQQVRNADDYVLAQPPGKASDAV